FDNPGVSIDERIFLARVSTLAVSLCTLILAALFAERRRQDLEARNQAELANRAKSNFLAAASHDLRQPLQSLMLLQSSLKPLVHDDEASALVTRIGRSANVMKGILDALLDINRLEGGDLHPSKTDFPLNDLLDSVTADFLDLIRDKGLEFRFVHTSMRVHSD